MGGQQTGPRNWRTLQSPAAGMDRDNELYRVENIDGTAWRMRGMLLSTE
jgi:hypothetical protein